MTHKEKLQAEMNRLKAMELWPKRLEALKTRKKNPKSEAEFCRDHGFIPSNFNRTKKAGCVPRQKKFDAIEAALRAEGV